MSRIARLTLLPFAALVLAGCAQDMSDLEQWTADVMARPGGRLEPPPQAQPYEEFIYAANDLRSPFVPTLQPQVPTAGEAGTIDGPVPDFNRNKEILEEFALDSLRMVGTVVKDGTLFALVLNSEGEIFRVRSGNYMGLNHGRIIYIDEASIRLLEIVPDGLGGWQERESMIGLGE